MLPWYQSDFCLHRGLEIKTDSVGVHTFLFVPLSSVYACTGFLLLLCSGFGTSVLKCRVQKNAQSVEGKKNRIFPEEFIIFTHLHFQAMWTSRKASINGRNRRCPLRARDTWR